MIEERYNKVKKCLIRLNKGEEWCKKCEGSGSIIYKRGTGMFIDGCSLICNRCKGDGKVDWLEKAIGKK